MTYIEILTFKMGNVFEFEFIVLSSCDSDALSLSLTPLNITRLLEPPLMEFDVLSDDLKLFFRFGWTEFKVGWGRGDLIIPYEPIIE